MNYIQFLMFGVYVASTLSAGSFICWYVGYAPSRMNRWVYLGEALLLGSIWIYGQMMVLSLAGLYRAEFLWAAVVLNIALLIVPAHRSHFAACLRGRIKVTLFTAAFLILVAIFVFRNLYFLVDVDSHSTYLYTQKIWLNARTSLTGDIGSDVRIFSPQFDAVPYGLGLSVLPEELLFPQLIVIYWRVIVLLLIFGYTTYRFDDFYGLAAVQMVLFNEHFFYSGANNWVIINGAIIALCFAATYNFWEGRRTQDHLSFVMALVFIVQLLSNKYQIVFVFFGLLGLGLAIQRLRGDWLRVVFENKRWGAIFAGSLIIALLWYLKNWVVTGLPSFPILAGRFGVFSWTSEMDGVMEKIHGPLPIGKILKYLNFLFVWPGIVPAKYVIVMISLWPFILLVSSFRNASAGPVVEVYYWFVVCLISVIGLCLAFWQEPRYYRYLIGVMAFAAVFGIDHIARSAVGVRHSWIIGIVLVILATSGYGIMWQQGGVFSYPTFADNLAVFSNRLSTAQVMQQRYPNSVVAGREALKHPLELKRSAWDTSLGEGGKALSSFLLPLRPQVGLWLTGIIRWASYSDSKLSEADLRLYGVDVIFRVREGMFEIVSSDVYAREAENFNRYPDRTVYDYGFPAELVVVGYD